MNRGVTRRGLDALRHMRVAYVESSVDRRVDVAGRPTGLVAFGGGRGAVCIGGD